MSDELNHILHEPISGLDYRLRAPLDGQTGGAPCLILLHGMGANESGFIELARSLDPRLAVVLARGPLALGPGRFGWFPVSFTADGPVIDAAQAERARRQLLALIEQLAPAHGIDARRVWIAGFSQGGIMSASVGLTAPGKVAGFGVLSGRILPEVLPLAAPRPALAALRAFVSHGVQDQTLGLHFAHASRQVLDGLGVPLAYHEYAAGHGLTPAMVEDFQRWLGAQLALSGDPARGSAERPLPAS